MREFIDYYPDSGSDMPATTPEFEIPEDTGAVTIVDGRIISMYRDPAIAAYLREHEQEVKWRVAALTPEERRALEQRIDDSMKADPQPNEHGIVQIHMTEADIESDGPERLGEDEAS